MHFKRLQCAEVNSQLNDSAALLPQKDMQVSTGGWVDPRASLDTVAETKIPVAARHQVPVTQVVANHADISRLAQKWALFSIK
jgi:hypothetical protein